MNPFQAIGQAIENFFTAIWNSAELSAFRNFAIQVFQAEKPVIIGQLASIAQAAVATVEADGGATLLTSATKRQAAVTQITSAATSAGITAGEADINLALEMAVTAMNNVKAAGNQGVVTASTTTTT